MAVVVYAVIFIVAGIVFSAIGLWILDYEHRKEAHRRRLEQVEYMNDFDTYQTFQELIDDYERGKK